MLLLKYILIGKPSHNSHLLLTQVNYNLFNRLLPGYAEINFFYHFSDTDYARNNFIYFIYSALSGTKMKL